MRTLPLWLAIATSALAKAPAQVPVQGTLLDDLGRPVDGPVRLTVAVYAAEADTAALYTESFEIVVDQGFFTVQLGETQALDLDLFSDRAGVWMGLQITDDPEMTPRIRVATTPYAAWADRAGEVAWEDVEGLPEGLRDGVDWGDIVGAPAGLEDGLDWSDVEGIPADLADGDANTTYTFRSGFLTFGTVIDVDGAWVEDRAAAVCFDTLEELLDELDSVYLPAGYVPSWSSLSGIPADILDGDKDTTYSPGTGLSLTGTVFAVDQGTIEDWAIDVCFDTETELTAALDDNYVYTAGTGLALASNEFEVDYSQLEFWVTDIAYDTEEELRDVLDASYDFGAGTGLVRSGTTFTVDSAQITTWAKAAAYDTEAELTALLDDNYKAASYTPSWGELTSVPAGFADNVDNDTTYTAAAPLSLSGTTFTLAACATGQSLVWSGSAWVCRAIVPSGAILFFNGACPAGWSEVTAARGRAIVGTPASGTNGGTLGTALTNLGTRTITSVPAHAHTVDPPAAGSSVAGGHNHGILSRQDDWNVSGGTGPSFGADNGAYTVHSGFGTSPQTTVNGDHTHSFDIGAFSTDTVGVSSVDVSMPYLQLTACAAP